MSSDPPPIIIDNGSSWIRAGFTGDEAPRTEFSTIVGCPQSTGKEKNLQIGTEAFVNRDHLKITYPIQWGVVTHWDDMEKIWHHVFQKELRVAPEEHPVLLTEPSGTPKVNREKVAELMFESFLCPALRIENQAVLALIATGRSTGLVMDIGGGVSQCVPIYEGYALQRGIRHRGLEGGSLTQLLRTLLRGSGQTHIADAESRVIRDIKEKLCFVALDFEEAMVRVTAESYDLPDGHSIDIGSERFRCPEALFQPKAVGLDGQSIQEKIVDSIMKVDHAIQQQLFTSIVLAGGSTMFAGFADRLEKELSHTAPADMKAKVVAPSQRKLSAWIGGSIITSMPTFEQQWISKEKYDEIGPSLVHRMCF